jgi:hypothetical protein
MIGARSRAVMELKAPYFETPGKSCPLAVGGAATAQKIIASEQINARKNTLSIDGGIGPVLI